MIAFIGRLENFQRYLTVGLILALPILVFIQVLLRYVFSAPLMGIEELMLFPTIWLYMLGGACASMKRDHISCGVLTIYIKKNKTNSFFNLVTSVISFIISSFLTFYAFKYFLYSIKVWKVSNLLHIPMFLAESSVFIGLLIMTIYTLRDINHDFRKFRNAQQPFKGDSDVNASNN